MIEAMIESYRVKTAPIRHSLKEYAPKDAFLLVKGRWQMEDGKPKKWIPEDRNLNHNGVEFHTWGSSHEGNFNNLFWTNWQALRNNDSEARRDRWWAIMAMFLN